MLKYRWLIIISSLMITAFFGWQLKDVKIDPDIKNNIPADMKSRLNTNKIEELFGKDNMFLVIFESSDILNSHSLARIKTVADKMERSKDFDRLMSPFNSKDIDSEDGMMIIDPAIKRIPRTIEQRESLRTRLSQNPLVYGMTISEDFTMAAIIADVNASSTDSKVLTTVKAILYDIPGDETVYMGGMPAIRARITNDVQRDLSLLLPAGLLIMLIMLFLFFKQIRGVLLPFIVVIMSIIFGMGFIPLLGWKLSMISILLPIMLIAIANDYGIHLVAKYQELNTPESHLSAKEISHKIFKKLYKPVLVTAVTTIVGMMALLSHVMIPAKQLGILAAISITFALLLSLFAIPSVLSLLPLAKPSISLKNKRHLLDSILHSISRTINRHPRRILYSSALLSIIMFLGILMVKVDANIENFFADDHPVKISSQLINENFGGSQSISILIEGDIKDPELLKRMVNYESEIEKMQGVGNAYSITSIIKEMNKAILGNEKSDQIPNSREAVAQLLELYFMSGDAEDFDKLVDFDFEKARIMVRLNDASSSNVMNVVRQIETLTENDSSVKIIGGDGLISAELSNTVVGGQVNSLLLALLSVVLIIMIIFRSPVAGLISGIPLVGSILLLFGLFKSFKYW